MIFEGIDYPNATQVKPTTTLINGDCFDQVDLVKKMEPNGVDLILTDPPYNIADKGKAVKSHGTIYSTKEAWGSIFKDEFTKEEYEEFITKYLKMSFELLKPGASVFTFIDIAYAGKLIEIGEKCGLLFKNTLTFVKCNPVPKVRMSNFCSAKEMGVWLIKPNEGKTPGGSPISPSKPAIFNYVKPPKGCKTSDGKLDVVTYHNGFSSNVFFYNIGKKRFGHPTEKYVGQIQPVIETLSNKSSVIFDPFAGSFAIGAVAQELGRAYIGVELLQIYYDNAVKELSNEHAKEKEN